MDTILGLLTTAFVAVLVIAGLAGAAAVMIISAVVKRLRAKQDGR